jgi:TatD DNase family protein
MVDTHCHLIDPQFKKDLEQVLRRAQKAGINKIINAGYDVATSRDAIAMAQENAWLMPAIGIHPNEAAAQSLKQMDEIRQIVDRNKAVAIGETGLDYYRDFSPKKEQQQLFREHINIARSKNLPLLIHTRNSVEDCTAILKQEKYSRGVFHCFSGTYEQACTILDIGFYLGFGGILTFSRRLRDVFKKLPVDRVLLETDAPFLAPAGHRGQRNEPVYILETLHFAAGTLDMLPEDLEKILNRNAVCLFDLSD